MKKKIFTRKENKKLHPWFENPWMIAVAIALLFIIWLMVSLVQLDLVSYFNMGLVLLAVLLVIFAAIFLFEYMDGKGAKVSGVLLCMALSISCLSAAKEVRGMTHTIQDSIRQNQSIHRTIGLYTLKQTPIHNMASLQGAQVGYLSSRSIDDTQSFANMMLETFGVNIHPTSYTTMEQMIKALKGQAVRAIFLPVAEVAIAENIPELDEIKGKLTLVKEYSFDSGFYNSSIPVNPYVQPYNILLSTSADPVNQQSYRSLYTAVLSVNPVTRKAIRVDLPRNLKVPYVCDAQLDCLETEDKLGLASIYSIAALKSTVESVLGISINYTMQVDLDSLLEVLDSSQALSVENKSPFEFGNYSFEQGEIELAASKLKTFAYALDDYSSQDLIYENNPGLILDRVIDFLKNQDTLKKGNELEIIAHSIATNMSYFDLCSFIKLFGIDHVNYDYKQVMIETDSEMQNSKMLTGSANMEIARPESLEQAKQAIQDCLGQANNQ